MEELELTPADVKQRYGRPSNWRGLWALGRDLLLLVAALAIALRYGDNLGIALLAIGFIGLLQFSLGESLLHEASHGNLFQQQRLNTLVGRLIGWSIFTTLEAWRAEHRIHHTQLLSPQDHLSADYMRYRLYEGWHPFVIWILRPLCGVIGWQWLASEVPAILHDRGIFGFYTAIGLFCYFTHSLDSLVLYWLLPLAWVYSSIRYWSEITDHYLAQSETRSNQSPFWNVMFHNGGYHWVHHQYPFIPGHLLKTADAALTPVEADRVGGWWQMYQVMLQARSSHVWLVHAGHDSGQSLGQDSG